MICVTLFNSFFSNITLTVSTCYTFYSTALHITRNLMSLSCDKENIQFKLTTVLPQNTSQHTDWVQRTPATHTPASRKARKASWKPADDKLLLKCLRQQQANPFTGVTRCDKQINRLTQWALLLGIRQPSPCDLKPRLPSGPKVY